MFCHGWQNKASRATDGSLNAGHVTPRKSNSDTLRLFLFSYNGTKITPALRKMPFTDLRHTIWTGDACQPQTSICRYLIHKKCRNPTKDSCTKNTLVIHYLPTLALSKSGSGLKHPLTLSPPVRAPRFPISSCRLSH